MLHSPHTSPLVWGLVRPHGLCEHRGTGLWTRVRARYKSPHQEARLKDQSKNILVDRYTHFIWHKLVLIIELARETTKAVKMVKQIGGSNCPISVHSRVSQPALHRNQVAQETPQHGGMHASRN